MFIFKRWHDEHPINARGLKALLICGCDMNCEGEHAQRWTKRNASKTLQIAKPQPYDYQIHEAFNIKDTLIYSNRCIQALHG